MISVRMYGFHICMVYFNYVFSAKIEPPTVKLNHYDGKDSTLSIADQINR